MEFWCILYCDSLEEAGADVEGADKSVEAVGASVDQASGGSEIFGSEGATNCGLLVSQEAGEQFGGDCGFAGEGRVGDQSNNEED